MGCSFSKSRKAVIEPSLIVPELKKNEFKNEHFQKKRDYSDEKYNQKINRIGKALGL
jgi:hypothetical protein